MPTISKAPTCLTSGREQRAMLFEYVARKAASCGLRTCGRKTGCSKASPVLPTTSLLFHRFRLLHFSFAVRSITNLHTMALSQKTIWYVIGPALVFQLIGAYVYFVLLADSSHVSTLFTLIKVCIFAWPLVWYVLGVRPQHTQRPQPALKHGVLTGVAALICVGVAAFLFQDTLRAGVPHIHAMLTAYHLEQHYILFALFISIVHSGLEEWYWRWFVYGTLVQHMIAWRAALISSVAFSAHHYIVLSTFFPWWFALIGTCAVGIAGYLWCVLYQRSGTVYASWVNHFFADIAIMAVGYILLF